MSVPDAIYYECHVTIEPVDAARLGLLKGAAAGWGFRVADLLMQNAGGGYTRSDKDSFCTSRDRDYGAMEHRMNRFAVTLGELGFRVWRKKIEAVVYDERTRA